MLKRRDLLLHTSQLACWYGLLSLGRGRRAWARAIEPKVKLWEKELDAVCAEVLAGRVEPTAWQSAVERMNSNVPVAELLTFLDLDAVIARIQYPRERLGAVQDVAWTARIDGVGHKFFLYREHAQTPPHAHNHLVSAHLVLKGQIRTRTFDRVEDLKTAIRIRPTSDRVCHPGDTVSMSDQRNNVHWFEGASSEVAVSFDVPVAGIRPDKKYRHPAEGFNQIFLDPTVKPRPDGTIDAPIIKFQESVRRFA